MSSKEEVRVKKVKAAMVTDLSLRKLLTKPAMVKKVVDRIRYKQQTQETIRPEELEEAIAEEQTDNWVQSTLAPSTTSM